jgi:hypothetical protein
MRGIRLLGQSISPFLGSPPRWLVRWGRLRLMILFTTLLALLLVQYPSALFANLDAAWSMVLVHIHRQGLQLGRDVAFTYGPFGFLVSNVYFDRVPLFKILWESAGKFALAATLVSIGAGLRGARFPAYGLALILSALIMPDSAFSYATFLLGIFWVLHLDAKPWQTTWAVIWMAFLSLVKFNYCIEACVAVVLASISMSFRGQWLKALLIIAGYVAVSLIFWTIAGQRIVSIPAYLSASWEISSGFLTAMALNQASATTWFLGLVLWLMFIAYGFELLRNENLKSRTWLLFYAGFIWFALWKYGFGRADYGHTALFFLNLLPLAVALPACFQSRPHWTFFDLAPVLCLIGVWSSSSEFLHDLPQKFVRCVHAAPGQIFRPERQAQRFADAERSDQKLHAQPVLASAVGRETIDAINFVQDELLRTRLNYQPRPIFQSYVAYTPSLLQRNLRFYQSSSAPQFVFAKLQSIDGRYRAQEDSLLLAELPRRYFAVLRAADYTLLRRKPVQPEYDSPRKVISRRPVVFGEEVTLPANDNYSVELRGFFKPSIYGALRGFVVQPAQVNIVLTDRAGKEHAGRLIPSIAKAGFVVQPLLESQQDFSSFIDGRVRISVRSIRFEPAAGTAKCWSRIDMQLAQLSDLPLRPLRPD